ncbi:MAG: ABC transporter permease [Acidimicrobiia bacterium]
MGFLGDVFQFISDNWSGKDGIVDRSIGHLQLSFWSVIVALLIALPPAVYLGHLRKGGAAAINIANVGRALPSYAILVLAFQFTDRIGAVPAVIALVALAIPPVFTNTYVGLSQVDPEVREAARGMGMSGWQQLRRIELPMSMPLIMAGIRTASVQVVATATLAILIGWTGTPGYYIIVGLRLQDNVEVFAGALVVVVLALGVEILLAGVQRLVVSKGLRGTKRSRWTVEEEIESEVPAAEPVLT